MRTKTELQSWIVSICHTCRTRIGPSHVAPTRCTCSTLVTSTSPVLSLMTQTVCPHTPTDPSPKLRRQCLPQSSLVTLTETHTACIQRDTHITHTWLQLLSNLLHLLLLQLKPRPTFTPQWSRTHVLVNTTTLHWCNRSCPLNSGLSCCASVMQRM
uniref:(northern house mosquito) hypothetical protein n=1 Tax=Culex pipiens TaxID=7175 RepID=A0A8D8J5I6_CULPI